MAFVLAGELKLGQATHLPWPVVGRLAPVVADLILIPLIGKLATDRGPLRRFQYACNPLVILICAIHGQLEPEVARAGCRGLRGGAVTPEHGARGSCSACLSRSVSGRCCSRQAYS